MAKSKRRARVSARAKAESRKNEFTSRALKVPAGVTMFRPKPGTVLKINILPFEAGEGNPNAEPGQLHYERTYHVHRGIGPSDDAVTCLKKTFGEKCPICEYRSKLDREEHEDEFLALAPKERVLYNIIDMNDREAGVQIWDISYHLFEKHLEAAIKLSDEEDGYEFFADPEDGLVLHLNFEKKSYAGREYGEVTSVQFKPRRQPLTDAELSGAHCLDDLIARMSYSELKTLFLQEDSVDDDDDDTPPPPKSKGKKAPVVDDDDDDTPPKSSKTKTKKPVDDDEFEWDDVVF